MKKMLFVCLTVLFTAIIIYSCNKKSPGTPPGPHSSYNGKWTFIMQGDITAQTTVVIDMGGGDVGQVRGVITLGNSVTWDICGELTSTQGGGRLSGSFIERLDSKECNGIGQGSFNGQGSPSYISGTWLGPEGASGTFTMTKI